MPDFAARRTMMVDTQVRPSDVTKFPIIDAMLAVPRERFTPDRLIEAAYMGNNIDIAPDRVLLEPRTLAKMLDALEVTDSDLVLDVACGTGYSSAVLARMAQGVVAVEEDEALAADAEAALAAIGSDSVVLHRGPLAEGATDYAPYDVIIVQGAAEHFPDTLAGQLAEGGRMACVFMDGALGVVRIGIKRGGQVAWRDAFNASAPVLPGFAKAKAFSL
ncbi:MAG: protein-L-isoaspartate O-methyltransferase [Rhodobacteraceae bacterium]|nr:protein-L-isoaspartate O-methyltransferase [Paracoccaceae bacterium]